jgi:hypothetical protein
MAKPTKFDQLPQEILDTVASLRGKGKTLDQIQAKLEELNVDVARSTTARHLAKIDEIGERLRTSRVIAEALTNKFGEVSDDRMFALNAELMMPHIMRLLSPEPAEDGTEQGPDEKGLMMISAALKNIAQAKANDSQRQIKERKLIQEEAARRVEKVAKKAGLSPESLKLINDAVLGATS